MRRHQTAETAVPSPLPDNKGSQRMRGSPKRTSPISTTTWGTPMRAGVAALFRSIAWRLLSPLNSVVCGQEAEAGPTRLPSGRNGGGRQGEAGRVRLPRQDALQKGDLLLEQAILGRQYGILRRGSRGGGVGEGGALGNGGASGKMWLGEWWEVLRVTSGARSAASVSPPASRARPAAASAPSCPP